MYFIYINQILYGKFLSLLLFELFVMLSDFVKNLTMSKIVTNFLLDY